MAKVRKLFDEEISHQHKNESSQLPLIPLAKKKASKNDTPL
jgi:hypothetical protein